MAKTGFLARWDIQSRSDSRLAALHSPGLARSYPLLSAGDDGRLQTIHFYHVADQIGPNQLHLGPPQGCVVLDHTDGTLIDSFSADRLGIAPFEEMVYVVPPDRQPAIRARVRELRALYDVIAPRFPHEPAGEAGPAFWEALQVVVPRPLLPAYQALAPEFVAWLVA